MDIVLICIVFVIAFALGYILARHVRVVGKLLVDQKDPTSMKFRFVWTKDYEFNRKEKVIFVVDPNADLSQDTQSL